MKRIKYMHSLQKAKKQKQKEHQSLPNKIQKQQHLQSIKTEAVKTLQNIQQDYLNKNHLNITLRNNQISFRNQYKRRSQSQKQTLRNTHSNNFTNELKTKYSKIKNQQHPNEPHNINIKQLLRIKTESLNQQENSRLLRNPFYKIQKARQHLFSSINKKDGQKQLDVQKKIQLQNQLKKQESFQKGKQFLVSRQKKQWYFASKKCRLKTLQQDQTVLGISNSDAIKKKMSQNISNLIFTSQQYYKKQPSLSLHTRKPTSSSIDFNSPSSVLQFDKIQSIMHEDEVNTIIRQQSRQQSPTKIRQKSLTVKYNEIKDYFQKKYQYKNQLHEDEPFRVDQFYGHQE